MFGDNLTVYTMVSFWDENYAKSAFSRVFTQFSDIFQNDDRSYIKGNTVFITRGASEMINNLVKKFLLQQDGAQPNGCHC